MTLIAPVFLLALASAQPVNVYEELEVALDALVSGSSSTLTSVVTSNGTKSLERSGFGKLAKVHGVNYGSRFVPEKFFGLYLTDDVLFKDVQSGQPGAAASLCDVGTKSDAGNRMSTYLDANIKQEHITKMASLGFNTIRLPLGYWNLIDLPAGSTPNGPANVAARWQRLQNILPTSSYRKWIDQIFQWASASGLKIMLELHGAPGAQAGNAFSGCDIGGDKVYYWDTDWNKQLSVQSIDAMAKICAEKGSTCWGLELLNEPFGYNHQGLSRDTLKSFYLDAIAAARKHLSKDVPLVIMDWPDWLASYWRYNAPSTFHEAEHGKIAFSTHMYQWPSSVSDLGQAEGLYSGNFNDVGAFISNTNFEVLISEYSLGSMNPQQNFDSNGFVRWMVEQADSRGAGSFIWNYDSYYSSWGPVNNQQVGNSFVDWKSIFGAAPPGPSPTPPPSPSPPSPPTPPSPSEGQCCFGSCGTSCQGGYCGESEEHCTGSCKGIWCPKSIILV